MALPVRGAFSFRSLTAAFGTVLNLLIPPKNNLYTVVQLIQYISGSTQHTLTLMRPQGTTTASIAAAGGQKAITLTADPGVGLVGPNGTASRNGDNAIAANHFIAYELSDGTVFLDKVSSVAAGPPIVLTMTTNVPTGGILVGGKIWLFGLTTDKDPITGLAFPGLLPGIGTLAMTKYGNDDNDGIWRSSARYQPLMLTSTNATVQGYFDEVKGVYSAA